MLVAITILIHCLLLGLMPPLLLGVDWAVLLLGVAGYVALVAGIVVVATHRAFRADVAGRFAEVGT